MKQTAVEFYVQKFDELLIKLDFNEISDEEYLEEKKHLTIIAKEIEKQQQGFSDVDVELIANEMVNWTIDNIGNPNPESGKKFDEVLGKYKIIISKEEPKQDTESLIRTTYEETMRGMVEWFANNKDKDPMDAESAIDNYIYPRLAEKGIVFKK
jgi:hypothetical protein